MGTISAQEDEPGALYFQDNGLDAPTPSEWPDDLPPAFPSPDKTSVCLPMPLAGVVLNRLQMLDVYPMVCQGVIEANRDKLNVDKQIALSACGEACEVDKAAIKAKSWAWWEMGLMVLGGVALGFSGGYVYHAVK